MGQQGRSVSLDVQLIIVRLSARHCKEDISAYTDVSVRSVQRVLNYFRKHGTVKALDPQAILKRHSQSEQLSSFDLDCVLGIIGRNPDAYLDEMVDLIDNETGQRVSKSTIWRYLTNAGFTMKKITKVAVERSVVERQRYLDRVCHYRAEQLVFVDESSVDRRTTYRGRAWSIVGTKAQRKAFFLRGRRFSVLPALSLDQGIIHCKIVEGAFRSDSFKEFILGLLDQMEPFPARNSVIVMDNCKIHKRADILEAIREQGVRYEFLPPYSPDFNPIELSFSAMKYHLRRDGDYARLAMNNLSEREITTTLMRALYTITPKDCEGWYRHCGYLA